MDELINRLIASLDANTEAHGGTPPGKTAPKAGKASAAPPPAKTTPPAKITAEMVKAKMIALRDKIGKEEAVRLLKKVTKANTLAELKPAYYASLMEAVEDAMSAEPDPEAEADEDDDDGL